MPKPSTAFILMSAVVLVGANAQAQYPAYLYRVPVPTPSQAYPYNQPPTTTPPSQKYPPLWYYDPYTDGTVRDPRAPGGG